MEATRNPDLLPGTLEMLILKTLTRGPNHGYGIAQHIQRVSEDALRIGEGSLYPALQRLPTSEWVVAEWDTSDTGRMKLWRQIKSAARRRTLDRQLQDEMQTHRDMLQQQ